MTEGEEKANNYNHAVCCSSAIPPRASSASPSWPPTSDLLEAKRAVEYFEIETRRFIGRGSGRMRSIWTLNPYRGCEFGCKYCYARYAHEFMELRDPELFERKIYTKQFQKHAFRAELRRLKPGETIWIGTATDPYQPAERRFRITRGMLEVFAGERGFDLGITTKSDLVARDAELLAQIGRRNSGWRSPHHHDSGRRAGAIAGTARSSPGLAFARAQKAHRCGSARCQCWRIP